MGSAFELVTNDCRFRWICICVMCSPMKIWPSSSNLNCTWRGFKILILRVWGMFYDLSFLLPVFLSNLQPTICMCYIFSWLAIYLTSLYLIQKLQILASIHPYCCILLPGLILTRQQKKFAYMDQILLCGLTWHQISSCRREIRTSTSSMTSVPKRLKYLRRHYGTVMVCWVHLLSWFGTALLSLETQILIIY